MRLVVTSLIEAGVDISFPEVWRAQVGLDSIAQAAGRCNREGELLPVLGRVVVFTSAMAKPPRALAAFQQAARPILRDSTDPLGFDAVADYFRALYAQKGADALDAAVVGGRPGILRAIEDAGDWRAPYAGIADAFRMIDETMQPVVIPWDARACELLDGLAHATARFGRLLRDLQPYVVGMPGQARADWLTRKWLAPMRRDLGDAVLRLADLRPMYRDATGLDLSDGAYRTSEENVW